MVCLGVGGGCLVWGGWFCLVLFCSSCKRLMPFRAPGGSRALTSTKTGGGKAQRGNFLGNGRGRWAGKQLKGVREKRPEKKFLLIDNTVSGAKKMRTRCAKSRKPLGTV